MIRAYISMRLIGRMGKALPLVAGMILSLEFLSASPGTEAGALRSGAFAEDPSLIAQPGQIVVLDSTGTDVPVAAVRYALQGGEHRFCLEGGDPYFTEITFETAWGEIVATEKNDGRCVKAEFSEGVYTLRVRRAASGGPSPSRVTYLSADPVSAPLTDSQGDALGGFWAVQPDPNADAQHRDGRLRSLPPITEGLLGGYSPLSITGMPIAMDYTGTQIDQYALFRFRYGAALDLVPFYPPNSIIDLIGNINFQFPNSGMLVVGTYVCPPDDQGQPALDFNCWLHRINDRDSPHNGEHLVIHDLGHYQFNFQWYGNPYYQPEPKVLEFWAQPYLYFQDETDNFIYVPGSVFYPHDPGAPSLKDSTGPFRVLFRFFPDGNVGTLQKGEVALYESCNYQGKAIVLGAELADFLEWNSDTVTLDKMGASVRLGNDAAISFYENTNFGGVSQTITADSSCTSNLSRGSIQIRSLTSMLVSTNKCPKCQLTGLDLSGLNLSGADLSEANLKGATLNQAVLTRAMLRQANLSGAKLYGAALEGANLESAILQSAYLTNHPPDIPQAADLSSAFLRNANLSFAQLSGANFTNSSFYGTKPAGTLKCGILNTGFTDHCATASGATLNNVNFSNAYLFGVDFSGSNTTIQGVQFGNAVLAGANFSQADISVDPKIGTNSGFSGAFLQGTNLGDVTTLVGTSLFQAFVDFRPNGNVIYLKLDGTHTTFPGYWGTPGAPVCAEMHYNSPTSVPENNTTITCPNGNPGACGPVNSDPSSANPNWKSGVDISSFASYQFDSTYVPATTPPACKPDFRWYFGGF